MLEIDNKKVNAGEIAIYKPGRKDVELRVKIKKDTIWLSQSQLAKLFGSERSVITKHLRNIFNSNELDRDSVCAKIAHTAVDGKIYKTQFYNLDAIISVGYRVNSRLATQFRIWATQVLKNYLLKGYVVNEHKMVSSLFLYVYVY
ncbi:virulence RhuM family protein [Patescibacteria group bacterium]|nr:virulence RhuM family protein [Patescibacteria group bacterium]MBU4162112.1 virulence RhuM family protein [Patescibacteria group bacterium]